MRLELPLLICGKSKHVKIDVCIFDCIQRQFLLFVHEEKTLVHGETSRAQAQLVVEAVAAYNENNAQREADGHPPLAEKVGHFVFLDPILRYYSLGYARHHHGWRITNFF